jgi:hypothetical protein
LVDKLHGERPGGRYRLVLKGYLEDFRVKYCADVNFIEMTYERADNRGFENREGLGMFPFTTVSRPALGPTQPPIQWVPEPLSLGVKWPGREADHSPPSSAEVKNK